jgi:tetratricopeptide (TPR) repeat protein
MYRDEKAKILCARWPVESLMYLLEAANTKTAAKVVSSNWSYAYYYKAYSLIELGRLSEAKELLGRAIALSPRNSQYLSELGNIYQREKDWPMALQIFQSSQTAAKEFTPAEAKNAELSRAWHGLGYVYVEQNKLDDAAKMYRQSLELDSNDKRAQNELQYIQNQRAKLGNQ